MARPQTKSFCRIVTLKSVIDGFTIEHKDEGHSPKTHNPGIGRRRIIRALDTKSKLDGLPAFKVVAVGPVPNRLDFDIPASKVPSFPDFGAHLMWGPEDDDRREAHADYRNKVSSEAQAAGIAEARREADKQTNVSEMAAAVAVAMKAVKDAEKAEAAEAQAAEDVSKAKADAKGTANTKPSARRPKAAPKPEAAAPSEES